MVGITCVYNHTMCLQPCNTRNPFPHNPSDPPPPPQKKHTAASPLLFAILNNAVDDPPACSALSHNPAAASMLPNASASRASKASSDSCSFKSLLCSTLKSRLPNTNPLTAMRRSCISLAVRVPVLSLNMYSTWCVGEGVCGGCGFWWRMWCFGGGWCFLGGRVYAVHDPHKGCM